MHSAPIADDALAAPFRVPPSAARGGALRSYGVAVAIAALLAVGCAAPRNDDLFGMNVDISTRQPWGADPALDRRLHDLIETSAAYHGLDTSLLWGMTLRIEDDAIDCGAVADARGCTWRDTGTVAVSTLAWTVYEPAVACVEDTPIPHELLHVMIGDPNHTDPRWSDSGYWSALRAKFSLPDCSEDPAILLW